MTPGEIIVAAGDIIMNEGREAITLTVANTGDRPITRVGHRQGYGFAPFIHDNITSGNNNFSGGHEMSFCHGFVSADWMMHGYQLGAIREGCFNLHVMNHFGNAGHAVTLAHHMRTSFH